MFLKTVNNEFTDKFFNDVNKFIRIMTVSLVTLALSVGILIGICIRF